MLGRGPLAAFGGADFGDEIVRIGARLLRRLVENVFRQSRIGAETARLRRGGDEQPHRRARILDDLRRQRLRNIGTRRDEPARARGAAHGQGRAQTGERLFDKARMGLAGDVAAGLEADELLWWSQLISGAALTSVREVVSGGKKKP